jgi:hypothetical protein
VITTSSHCFDHNNSHIKHTRTPCNCYHTNASRYQRLLNSMMLPCQDRGEGRAHAHHQHSITMWQMTTRVSNTRPKTTDGMLMLRLHYALLRNQFEHSLQDKGSTLRDATLPQPRCWFDAILSKQAACARQQLVLQLSCLLLAPNHQGAAR